jgi:hypothetical protein
MTAIWVAVISLSSAARAGTLEVGSGKTYPSIMAALAKAQSGDVILVHAPEGGKSYEKQALQVRKGGITFRAEPLKDGRRVKLDGAGFDYSGSGSVPRAIFQFDGGADGCLLEGFELTGAHNDSHNGAGVRINQASNVTIRNCEIHDNDMGIMSNGNGSPTAAVNQRIENCVIHHNGSLKEPGYNHNLYLGGTSVTLTACEVYASLTGHNVKSRAHHTRVEFCYIHDSCNREFDLVDAKGDTTAPASDAVLVGNVIAKAKNCSGNRTTIHFGQDGGNEHDGTIYLVHNTIVSGFLSPIVELSAGKAKACLINNIVWDGGSFQAGQQLVAGRAGAAGNVAERLSGECNWLSSGFAGPALTALKSTTMGDKGIKLPFADAAKGNYLLTAPVAGIVDAGLAWSKIVLPPVPGAPAGGVSGAVVCVAPATQPRATAAIVESGGSRDASTSSSQPAAGPAYQYKHPAGMEPRPSDDKPDLGAYEFQKK